MVIIAQAKMEVNPQALATQSGDIGARLCTGKFKKRSRELRSWLRASM